jgi:hypothetical protein
MVFRGTTDLTFLTLHGSRSIIRFQSSLIGYGTLKDVHYKLKIQVQGTVLFKCHGSDLEETLYKSHFRE